ncbi:MAG: TonB family protein [Deltaproteobacteria bacterium]|nr:TonB family protein [Deltaproteobacteria bacterium]MBN2672839.1 TonB family protein [Deltaproteobacteria bacterium]
MFCSRWLYQIVISGLLLLFTTYSVAQDTDAQSNADTDAIEMVAPRLLDYVQAEYPEKAFAEGLEAAVLTEISIDENGVVTGVKIVEPAGHGFDEAAEDAIYQFLFEPATRGGIAIPSKVLYRYTFFVTAQAPGDDTDSGVETQPQTPAQLLGTIADMDGNPIGNASLSLVKIETEIDLAKAENEADILSSEVDKNGAFQFAGLSAGLWQVDIVAAGYKPLSMEETLENGELREVIYRLELEAQEFETVVRGRKPPREVTRREITRREITRIPGTGGDALRSVQNLPGMARAPGFGGQLLVRGSAPDDSKYFFDTMPIPMLYHFGGLTSVINSDLLDRIDFYPGNYSVRYGSATGGIVDVYPKTPETDRFHGYMDADLWDISALVETPINEDWSIAVSGRRSYVDAILKAVMPDDGGFQFTVAPRYYDYQLITDYHPDKKRNLRLFVFGSDDKVVFLFGNQVVGDPTFSGGMNFRTAFHQAQLRYRRQFTAKVSNEANLASGFWFSESSLGDQFTWDSKAVPIFFRDEMEWKAHKKFILRTGVDIQAYWTQWTITAAMNMPLEGENMDPLDTGEPMTTEGEGWSWWPAVYSEFEYLPIDRLRIIPGLRLAWFDEIDRFGFDPRLVVRHQLFRHTVVKGGVGLFNQAPHPATTDKVMGNPNLKLIKAMHYSMGVEQDILPQLKLSIEGFYKQLFDLVVAGNRSEEQVISDEDTGPSYVNEGKGSVYGLELLLKHQPTDHFFGWIAYTFMKSTRIDHPGEEPRPFDYDQTHILTIVANVVIGRGWEAGVRFRLVSGNPDTPILGSFYNADSDSYWPIYGATNSDRMPPFHQLDFRIDKTWIGKHTKQSVYLDIQNVYNRKNPEGYSYNYDFSERVYFNGMPLFPSLGFKLEY